MEETRPIGVIGTGNYGTSLAKRLHNCGYDVVIGSRNPTERNMAKIDKCFCDVVLTTNEKCIKRCNIIVISIHSDSYKDTLLKHRDILSEKILIDVSNTDKIKKGASNAEYLQSLLPESRVVKCFNVISAYQMENDLTVGSKRVFIAGDNQNARQTVANMSRDLGFIPVDYGALKQSKQIETFPHGIFKEWRLPILLAIGIFNVWALFVIYLTYIKKTAYHWDQLFIKVPNKPICMTAVTMLALTYLPGSMAGFVQLWRGSKHQRFPKWLDVWLKQRKQFGLVAFGLATLHAILSVLIMSPTYLRSWYRPLGVIVPQNMTEDLMITNTQWMIWKGEAACLTGILAFLVLCILAISTIPSIADTLNWKEWTFVQSKLGYLALFLSALHEIVMGAPNWLKNEPSKLLESITFMSVLLPIITLILKLILCLPCVSLPLEKIRRGHERKSCRCKQDHNKNETVFGARLISTSDEKSAQDYMELKNNHNCACDNIV